MPGTEVKDQSQLNTPSTGTLAPVAPLTPEVPPVPPLATPDANAPTPDPAVTASTDAAPVAAREPSVPSDWSIVPTKDGISARNRHTNELFEGEMAAFNKLLRG